MEEKKWTPPVIVALGITITRSTMTSYSGAMSFIFLKMYLADVVNDSLEVEV